MPGNGSSWSDEVTSLSSSPASLFGTTSPFFSASLARWYTSVDDVRDTEGGARKRLPRHGTNTYIECQVECRALETQRWIKHSPAVRTLTAKHRQRRSQLIVVVHVTRALDRSCSPDIVASWWSGIQTLFFKDFYFMIFNFSVVFDLQCSVNFYCTAKWPSHTYIYIYNIYMHDIYIYICVYIYILFLTLSSIRCHHKWLDIVPRATQQDRIAYPLQMQEFASINPRLPIHPTPSPTPLATQVCSPSPWFSFLFCAIY